MASAIEEYTMAPVDVDANQGIQCRFGQLTADAGGSSLAVSYPFTPKIAFAVRSDTAASPLVCAISGQAVTFTSPAASKVYYTFVMGRME